MLPLSPDLVPDDEQAYRAEHMELVGRLAVELAHDFNNLLTVIQSFGGLALEGAAEGSELHGDLSELMRAARRAGELSHQLVTFGRRTSQPRLVDVNRELERASGLLHRLAGTGVTLTVVPDPGLWPVTVDPAQLTRAVAGLVLAARDAGPADGRITIATANRGIPAPGDAADVPPGDHVALTVSAAGDDAAGRPGSALRMAGELARRAGGHLHVTRAPDGKVTTTLLLPRPELAAAASAGRTAAALVPGGTETILLVEDDAVARLTARRALVELGYTVLEAGDGTEALELCEQHASAIHLVVAGAGLPGGDGHALAQRVRAACGGARVLALSDVAAPERLTADALARRVRAALDDAR